MSAGAGTAAMVESRGSMPLSLFARRGAGPQKRVLCGARFPLPVRNPAAANMPHDAAKWRGDSRATGYPACDRYSTGGAAERKRSQARVS